MGKVGQAKQVFHKFSNNGKKLKTKADKAAGKKYTPCKLKKGLEPGAVLILLAGRFRGRRVIFLKQLASGSLLLTGPYNVNGVPLRRANQRYCIGTSTKVDLNGADVKSITDDYFAREKRGKKKGEAAMFATEVPVRNIPADKKATQKKVDEAVSKNLSAEMKGYLKARFSLSSGMYPHALKF